MGLHCFDATRVTIFKAEHGLPADSVRCLSRADNGRMLIGTSAGLVAYDGNTLTPVEGAEEISGRSITGLTLDGDSNLWVGMMDGELFMLGENGMERYSLLSAFDGEFTVENLVWDRAGRLWFSCTYRKGFGFFENGELTYFSPSDTADYPSWVRALEVDAEGHVWIGSGTPASWDGICRYDGRSFRKVDGVGGAPILSLCCDQQG